jgi:pimeloyl-ACP methyl ester carboxylesterase
MYSRNLFSGLLLAALPLSTSAAGPSTGDCAGIKGISPRCSSQESAYHRDVFYVGGGYVDSGIPGQQMWSDQLYVEKLTPTSTKAQKKKNKPYPIVFVSAGVNTGAEWLNTPDNRKGWASYYLDQGYQVYIVDIPANGRSSQQQLSKYPLRIGSTDVINEQGFTAPENFDQYPQADLHNQWPGNGSRGDPIFDAFTAANGPISSSSVAVENTMRTSGCALLSLIGQAYSICHSAGCTYTAIWSDACPDLLRANINIEPGNIPFTSLIGNATVPGVGRTPSRPCGLTSTPLQYDPPVTNCSASITTAEVGPDTRGKRSCILQTGTNHKLTQVGKVPYVMITGEASPHATYDHCFVEYFKQMGIANYQWIKLGDMGIKGNGHFMFLEENNLEIATAINRGLNNLNGGPAAPGHPALPVTVK